MFGASCVGVLGFESRQRSCKELVLCRVCVSALVKTSVCVRVVVSERAMERWSGSSRKSVVQARASERVGEWQVRMRQASKPLALPFGACERAPRAEPRVSSARFPVHCDIACLAKSDAAISIEPIQMTDICYPTTHTLANTLRCKAGRASISDASCPRGQRQIRLARAVVAHQCPIRARAAPTSVCLSVCLSRPALLLALLVCLLAWLDLTCSLMMTTLLLLVFAHAHGGVCWTNHY